jgi:hypothetical protein
MVNNVLRSEKESGHVKVYIDDILIHMENNADNWYWTRQVLATLVANKLFIWLKKCSFEQPKIEFLGMVIQKGEVGVSLDKVKAMVKEKPPTMKKGVQCFLGIMNYHCWFTVSRTTL